MKLDLNLLPLFVAVAEAASMSEAARRLSVPKSSVSRGIAALEASLGVQLFHRTTRQLRLTTAGTAFFEKSKPLVSLAREATQSLPEQADAPSGTLRLTAPIDLGLTVLPELTASFTARFPEVRLEVHLSNTHEDLVGRGFDVALRISRRLADSSLVARKLASLEFRLYAAPGVLARLGTPRSLEELRERKFVTFRQLGRALPFAPRARVDADDVAFAWQAVRAGVGFGVLPTFLAQPDVAAGRLVNVVPRWAMGAGALWFIHPRSAHLPRKVTAFRELLLENLRRWIP
ncbi:MAG: LysR substrate-binding domain-containing protein [Myxococcota bacterium]